MGASELLSSSLASILLIRFSKRWPPPTPLASEKSSGPLIFSSSGLVLAPGGPSLGGLALALASFSCSAAAAFSFFSWYWSGCKVDKDKIVSNQLVAILEINRVGGYLHRPNFFHRGSLGIRCGTNTNWFLGRSDPVRSTCVRCDRGLRPYLKSLRGSLLGRRQHPVL